MFHLNNRANISLSNKAHAERSAKITYLSHLSDIAQTTHPRRAKVAEESVSGAHGENTPASCCSNLAVARAYEPLPRMRLKDNGTLSAAAYEIEQFRIEDDLPRSTPHTIRPGTILIVSGLLLPQALTFSLEHYSPGWSIVTSVDAFRLDREIRQHGWNFFFIAARLGSISIGTGDRQIRAALRRILAKTALDCFNALEVTAVSRNRFLGIPYTTVSAHARHLQKSQQIENLEQRDDSQRMSRSAAKAMPVDAPVQAAW